MKQEKKVEAAAGLFHQGVAGGNPGGGGSGPTCEYFGASITNSVVPIECEPGPGGNPWPTQTSQDWLDFMWMVNRIKDSTSNTCVANVLSSLKTISSKLPKLLRTVFDTVPTNGFDVTFKMANLGTYEGGATEKNVVNFDYKVKINSFFTNATDLSVAATIIHETFHCQIMAWYRQAYLLNDTALKRELAIKYGFLFTKEIIDEDSSLTQIVNGPDVLQHQAIATRYRDSIGAALYEFAQAKGISVTLEYCKDLAWAGCFDSKAFLALSNSNQADITRKVNAEKTRTEPL